MKLQSVKITIEKEIVRQPVTENKEERLDINQQKNQLEKILVLEINTY